VPDHDGVSVGALVQQVRQVLGRAHALFGDPASSGGSAAAGAGGRLAGAGDVVRSGQSQISALSGQFAAGYGLFAAGAGLALDDLASADERLSTRCALILLHYSRFGSDSSRLEWVTDGRTGRQKGGPSG
jgi:hypothetical protein